MESVCNSILLTCGPASTVRTRAKEGEEVARQSPKKENRKRLRNTAKWMHMESTQERRGRKRRSLEDEKMTPGDEENTALLEEDSTDDTEKKQGVLHRNWAGLHSAFKAQKKKREEERSVTLPEELVEEIVAHMTYPHIFKARLLSKSWLARLSPIASLQNEEDKLLAISFQKKFSAAWIRVFEHY